MGELHEYVKEQYLALDASHSYRDIAGLAGKLRKNLCNQRVALSVL